MSFPHHPGRMERPSAAVQLPAFCRTRRLLTTPVRVSSLRHLQWVLWLVLTLQLSTTLLLLAGPMPAPLAPALRAVAPAPSASRYGAQVPSASQP